MKKHGSFKILNNTIIALLVLMLPAAALAVGTVTQAVTTVCEPMSTTCFRTLTFVATADASAATYPSTAVTTANMDLLKGWYLIMCSTVNGATAPTALYDVTLTDSIGVDILGTAGYNRPGTAAVSSQFTPITDTTYASAGLRPVASTLTLAVSNNAVNSGSFTMQCFFVK